ncbi:MAG TPA: DUF3240 family protein [Limnobacter sp.]|uniref:DUF3240 family protein n=1 Tax=Limnobacter sp. TaxID=2003368 RepID=UPI002E360F81|nr:DUF3240 family protein [Limnobacter sp.]HEX5485543.1 DUF3240 family protein [Limnobacter sp.]
MILLTITAPHREQDWLKGRLQDTVPGDYRMWTSEVQESGPGAPLESTYEQVTGAARMVRVQLLLPQADAQALIDKLRQGRHPQHVEWMMMPLLEQGVL